jgi:hypothetical protein
MTKPRWLDIQAPNVELKALTWGHCPDTQNK